MRGVERIPSREAHRVRRWDVVILGGALPGLIAAVRLGQRGARVLVLEETAAAENPLLLREPFLLTGAESGSVLGGCLQTLGVPLIDQRRLLPLDVAVQVVLPDARVDFGRAALTASELIAWGLAKPDEARALIRALEQAAQAEREAMESGAARPARRRRDDAAPAFARGWPREAAEASPPLQALLAALTRGLSNLGVSAPSPEAHARLIGGLLGGGSEFAGGDPSLGNLIRRRAKTLFAEFRSVDRPFHWVSVANQPGIALADPDEILAGRVLVLNAPLAGLREQTPGGELPEWLRGPEPVCARFQRHLRGPGDLLPDGMASRVVCVPPTAAESGEAPVVTLRRWPGPEAGQVELVASAVGPREAPVDAMEGWIDRVLERLLPFAAARLTPLPIRQPRWDREDCLGDPTGGRGWPTWNETRRAGRLPVHQLDRSLLGGLGFEGDLLLGLHAADAIAAELP